MQINMEQIKKMRKFLSFNNPNASRPMISEKFALVPALGGGVCGKVKLNNPNAAETIAVRRNVLTSAPSFSQASHPMINPATIHPIVPHTLISENCFSGLAICLNETEFTNASVGI
jgi:hypothetical protein